MRSEYFEASEFSSVHFGKHHLTAVDALRISMAVFPLIQFFRDQIAVLGGVCAALHAEVMQRGKMEAEKWDGELLEELCKAMADASICGLGQAAPNPIRCVMKSFGGEVG